MKKLSEEIKLPEIKADDIPEVKDAELPKEVEEERDIHGDDGEQKRPEFEEIKKEVEDSAKEELNDKEDLVVDEINDADTPKPLANNGEGKNVKIKGLTEKISLEEPSDILTEGYKNIGPMEKLARLVDLDVSHQEILDYILANIPEERFNILLNGFIAENDLEDEFEFIDEDFPSSALDEAIPKDLAKSYHKAGYHGTKGANTDLQNSEYEEITPEEAKKIYKQDPTSIKLLIGNKLIDFRDNGKPSLDHRSRYVSDDKAYTRSSGQMIFDTKRMPVSHLLSIADKIYKVNEIAKDSELLAKRSENPESKNYRGSNLPNTNLTGYYSDIRGSNGWSKYDTDNYKRWIKGYENQLNDLQREYDNGEWKNNLEDYRERKEYLLDKIGYYKDKLSKEFGKQKDYNSRKRYANSELNLRKPFEEYREIKSNLNKIDSKLDSTKKTLERVKEVGSPNTLKNKEELKKAIEEIAYLQKKIDIINLKLENSDIEDAEELEIAEKEFNKLNDENTELVSRLNRLLGRN